MNKEGQQFLNNVLGEVFNIHDIHVYTRINIAFWKTNIFYPYLESLGGLSSFRWHGYIDIDVGYW